MPQNEQTSPALTSQQTDKVAQLLASTPVVGELGELFAAAGHEL